MHDGEHAAEQLPFSIRETVHGEHSVSTGTRLVSDI